MKKLLFISTALLMGIGLVLGFLELFLRINPKFGYSISSYRTSNGPWWDYPCFRHSSLLGLEHIPNADGINSYGMISKEYQLNKNKNTFRILILGDSVGEGFDTGFLENLLNSNPLFPSRYNFEIWNAAVGGYDIRRYYLYLNYKGLSYKPDMVVIFFCLNDFDLDTNIYYLDEKKTVQYCFPVRGELFRRYRPNLFLLRYSKLCRFIILRSSTYLSNSKGKMGGVSRRYEDGKYYLDKINQICKRNNLPLLAVVFPYFKPIHKYWDYQKYQYQDMIRAIRAANISYLDLHGHFSEKDLYNLRTIKEDEIHSKGEKCHPLAKIIYNYLLENAFSENNEKL